MPQDKTRPERVVQPDARGYTKEQEADILKFYPPANPTPEQEAVIVDIASLDHRSLHRLRPGSSERQEVKRLLWNAVTACCERGSASQARLLYKKAEDAYYDFVQVRNRLRYLVGMLIGVLAAAVLGTCVVLLGGQLEPYVSPGLLPLMMLFAGLGSIASVLGRLSSIDLRQEPSEVMILISGATKPLVAIIFAVVVFLILDSKVLDIKIGTSAGGGKNDGIYLVTSFLCGFSERFATDIISRVSFEKKT
jgi:hypothetical protein